jgi:ATP-dependent RNA helicase DDX3X
VRVYGQEPVVNQIREVAKGADIIVATPGRLWDFVSSRIVVLTEVNTLVIDEADIMISRCMDGFIREIVEKFDMPSKDDRQTMMFSATFPAEIQTLAAEYLYDHVWIGIGPVGGTSCTVSQDFRQVEPQMKLETLKDQLYDFLQAREEGQRVIVFTNSKNTSKKLDTTLWDSKIESGALHGDLTQAEREQSLNRFRKGDIDVLVCTDLASRGLDIGGVAHVINYDMPRDINVYVQRIGRTGRIGRRGFSTTYIAVKDGHLLDDPTVIKALADKMKEANCKVPAWLERHATHQEQRSTSENSKASQNECNFHEKWTWQ